jgi:prevent-host-death family protein
MRTVSAIDVRKRFGEILDEAGAGERIVIERAGHPVAALVPLSDLATLDPGEAQARRLAALDDLRRMAAKRPAGVTATEAAAMVRAARDARQQQIAYGAGKGSRTVRPAR